MDRRFTFPRPPSTVTSGTRCLSKSKSLKLRNGGLKSAVIRPSLIGPKGLKSMQMVNSSCLRPLVITTGKKVSISPSSCVWLNLATSQSWNKQS